MRVTLPRVESSSSWSTSSAVLMVSSRYSSRKAVETPSTAPLKSPRAVLRSVLGLTGRLGTVATEKTETLSEYRAAARRRSSALLNLITYRVWY